MENIDLVMYKHGRKTKRGLVTMAGRHAVCIVHNKSERKVYFGLPGSGDDWLEVYSLDLKPEHNSKEIVQMGLDTVSQLTEDMVMTWDKDWLDHYRSTPHKNAHPDYVRAVLASHKAFTGKDWK